MLTPSGLCVVLGSFALQRGCVASCFSKHFSVVITSTCRWAALLTTGIFLIFLHSVGLVYHNDTTLAKGIIRPLQDRRLPPGAIGKP